MMILLVFTGGCIDPIDLDIDREGRQLVVYSHIDDGSGPYFVQLSRTTQIPFNYQPETGARITLHDDLGNEGRFYSSNDEGIYYYNEFSMQIVAGRCYTLRIRSASGNFYESEPECIPVYDAHSEVQVEFKHIEENTGSFDALITINVMEVSAQTTLEDPTKQYYIRYSPIQTFRFDPTNFPDPFNSIPPECYVERRIDPERLVLFSSVGFSGTRVPPIFLAQQQIDFAFITRNIISVETHLLTPRAYEYWRQISILLNNTGSIFDIPPAAVKGNIFNIDDPEEQVLGYFEATNVSVARTMRWRGDFPYTVPDDPCLFDPTRPYEDYPRECIDCRRLDGSGYRRPTYY